MRFPNHIFESFSIVEDSILFGIFYPRSLEEPIDSPVSYHDFMITTVPYELWPYTGRLIIRVKQQSKALHEIGAFLSEKKVNINYSSTIRSGHRYSTIDIHVNFDDLDSETTDFNETNHYYERTNEKLENLSKELNEKLTNILFSDPNDKDLKQSIYHRINTGLHYFHWVSQKRQAEAQKNHQDMFLYKSFSLRYKRAINDPTQGLIIANSGGKINNLINQSQKEEEQDEELLPSLVFASLDSHYLNFRVVILPKNKTRHFIKLIVGYQRHSAPHSTRGLMGGITKVLNKYYKIWQYYGQLIECRKDDDSDYGAGKLIFYIELRDEVVIDMNHLQHHVESELSALKLPSHLKRVKLYPKASPLFPELIEKLNKKSTQISNDIFISYSYKNQVEAEKLRDELERFNFRCFLSSDKLKSGDPLDIEIKQAIKNSKEICLIYSHDSSNSSWVLHEWSAAWALDKRCVVMLLDIEQSHIKHEHLTRIKKDKHVDFSEKGILKYIKDLEIRRLHWDDY